MTFFLHDNGVDDQGHQRKGVGGLRIWSLRRSLARTKSQKNRKRRKLNVTAEDVTQLKQIGIKNLLGLIAKSLINLKCMLFTWDKKRNYLSLSLRETNRQLAIDRLFNCYD